jgi:hypothetical protein
MTIWTHQVFAANQGPSCRPSGFRGGGVDSIGAVGPPVRPARNKYRDWTVRESVLWGRCRVFDWTLRRRGGGIEDWNGRALGGSARVLGRRVWLRTDASDHQSLQISSFYLSFTLAGLTSAVASLRMRVRRWARLGALKRRRRHMSSGNQPLLKLI